MEYKVIQTGSAGNCVILEDVIAVDMGVSWKAIAEHVNKLQLILLTHAHGDHFRKPTIKRLAQERPTLRFACAEFMAAQLVLCGVNIRQIDVLELYKGYDYGYIWLKPILLKHNTPNTGWHINVGGINIFYATDCNTLDKVEAKGYEYYFVEANYDEKEIVERIKHKQEAGESYIYEWQVLKNHLSKEKAEDWLYSQMGQHSRYVLLHGHQAEVANAS